RRRSRVRSGGGRRRGSTPGRTRSCGRAAAPRPGRGSGCTSRPDSAPARDARRDRELAVLELLVRRDDVGVEASGNDGADLHLLAILDPLAVGQQQIATDDHGRAGEDAEVGEELSDAPPATDLDRALLRAEVNTHGPRSRRSTLPEAPSRYQPKRGRPS